MLPVHMTLLLIFTTNTIHDTSHRCCVMPSTFAIFRWVDNFYLRVITSIWLKMPPLSSPPSILVTTYIVRAYVCMLSRDDDDTFVMLILNAKCQPMKRRITRVCATNAIHMEWIYVYEYVRSYVWHMHSNLYFSSFFYIHDTHEYISFVCVACANGIQLRCL